MPRRCCSPRGHLPFAFEHRRRGPRHRHRAPGPGHATVRRPPRVSTRTTRSSSPRRMPATTAAQAPGAARRRLPRASLPDAQPNVSAIHHLHVAHVHALRETAGRARSAALASVTGARSTSATTCTACGLPIETSVTCTVLAVDVERPDHGVAFARERDLGRREARHAHVDRHQAAVDDFRARSRRPPSRRGSVACR